MKKYVKKMYESITHYIGRVSKKYYFEDHVRVYPDGLHYDRFGRKIVPTENDLKNYLNHRKFYEFSAQFVKGKKVADIGCGSGYGCEILKKRGAAYVSGADISEESIRFASSRYGDLADFSMQGITDLKEYQDRSFDIAVCSEVLEHIKEYGLENRAIVELKRIVRPGGLLIIGTPNVEMIEGHGFSYEEMDNLLRNNFVRYYMFENALVPSGSGKISWERRLASGMVGIIITEKLNFHEIVTAEGEDPQAKSGLEPGKMVFADFEIDTTLLHNTHSWVVLAIR
jgi:2-polyprenyl-3-methyl-5-hydroxy-6-metoxy-1,4-benzoquinol methylase